MAIADGRCRVVHICGDLDIATRDEFYEACVTGDHSAVVIDMSRLTFLDCSGYGALVAVRLAIQQRGGSVVVRRPMGQPAHLLTLLAESGVVCERRIPMYIGGGLVLLIVIIIVVVLLLRR
ncbi:MAG: STAS domain-containing protein [Ilumatobacteraceae bacterium]